MEIGKIATREPGYTGWGLIDGKVIKEELDKFGGGGIAA